MQTEFNFNVRVDIGMTAGLAELVEDILGYLRTHTPTAGGFGRYQSVPETAQAVTAPHESQESQKQQKPEAQAEDTPEAKALTEEDVRTAMHLTRQRIEGEDYRDNTTSEGYQKYHKTLTAQFKNIASLLGANKPSLLAPEQRQAFIDACSELTVKGDGTIGTDAPF